MNEAAPLLLTHVLVDFTSLKSPGICVTKGSKKICRNKYIGCYIWQPLLMRQRKAIMLKNI